MLEFKSSEFSNIKLLDIFPYFPTIMNVLTKNIIDKYIINKC